MDDRIDQPEGSGIGWCAPCECSAGELDGLIGHALAAEGIGHHQEALSRTV
jgi:hypothetical protein